MQTEKNLTLWQLTNEHQKLLSELYDFETGEVNEIVQAKLNALCKTEEEKCITTTHWMKKLESDRKQVEDVLTSLKNRIAAYDAAIERHKKDLEFNMLSQGITKISCPYFTIRLKKNPYGTEITNKAEIPGEFIKLRVIPEKIEHNPDKNLIKEEVLRTGKQVPGAYVSQKNKLEILMDKI